MPLSNAISPHNLVPGKKYLIDVQWNLSNNLRLPTNHIVIGTFMQSSFVRGRTQSFDTGLQLLRSRSRYEATFSINGKLSTVSTVNKFYEILTPSASEFAAVRQLYLLRLPNDLKKYIASFMNTSLNLTYRANPNRPRSTSRI
jgi:hypothetical protein